MFICLTWETSMSIEKEKLNRAIRNEKIYRGDAESFLLYVETIFKFKYKKKFRRTWWDELLAQALMDLLFGVNDRLLLEMPPRHGKTERGVRMLASYAQGIDEQIKIQYGTYGDTLSKLTSTETKEIMESSIFKEIFPTLDFSRKLNLNTHWLLKAGGGFLGTSVSGGATGMGAEIGIFDDLLKAIEGDSKAKRDEAYKYYVTSGLTRLEGRKAVLMIMQRLHPDDPAGRVIEKQGLVKDGGLWQKISLPAINNFKEFYDWIKGRHKLEKDNCTNEEKTLFEQIARTLTIVDTETYKQNNPNLKNHEYKKYEIKRNKVYYYQLAREAYLKLKMIEPTVIHYNEMKVIRPPLTPLDEEEYGLDYLVQQRTELGEIDFNKQYLQEVNIDRAGYFLEENITYVTDIELPDQYLYIIIDPAESEKKTSDDRAIGVYGKSVDESEVVRTILMDGRRGKWGTYDLVAEIINMMMKYPTARVFLEGAGGGITIKNVLNNQILIMNAKLQKEAKDQITASITVFPPDNTFQAKNKRIKLLTKPLESHTFQIYKFMDTDFKQQFIYGELLKFNPEKTTNTDNCIDTAGLSYSLPDVYPKRFLEKKEKTIRRHSQRKTKRSTWRGY
ncbi:MAG: Unknown protein [uncultured Sulfurovum sp.]|uniref:Uncharacterized protein n=1 Tax=uncultured Sulfurovum sp. TaxID=269237 RepID=A0A6S6SE02_9BACT|nr:MAG: Unknown protein [uncultured Sulfurovum sp.]